MHFLFHVLAHLISSITGENNTFSKAHIMMQCLRLFFKPEVEDMLLLAEARNVFLGRKIDQQYISTESSLGQLDNTAKFWKNLFLILLTKR